MKYSIWGPNSNSVAFSAVQTYYTIDDPPGALLRILGGVRFFRS